MIYLSLRDRLSCARFARAARLATRRCDGVDSARPGAAHPAGITVTTALEPEEPRVGDCVRLTIEVEHSTDLLIAVAEPAKQPDLELIEVQPASIPPATSSAWW